MVAETQMLQVGEDRLAEGVEERGESCGADKIVGERTADQSVLSQDEATRIKKTT